MQKVFKITLDISKKVITPTFEVNTNDLKSVKLLIAITNGQTLLDLTDTTVRIAIRKPDNNIIFQDCTIKDAVNGQVEIILENQAYISAGTHTAEIMCYKGSEVVAVSGTFSYKSTKGIMNDEAVESKSEFTTISNMMKDVQDTIDDIRENGTGIDAQARSDIEDVTTQLAEMPKTVNGVAPDEDGDIQIEVPKVDTTNLRLKTEKISQIDVSEELLQQMAGDTPINAVPANKSLTPAKYADGSIERHKTTFLKAGKNLFNYDARTIGYSFDVNGNPIVNPDYDITDFIPVTENVKFTFNKPRMMFHYDAEKKLIGTKIDNPTQSALTVTIPNGASYSRAAIYKSFSATFQVELGEVVTAFEPFKLEIKKINIGRDNLEFNSVSEGHMVENSVTARTAEFINEGKNLYNVKKATAGGYLQETSGALINNANFTTSEFRRIKKGETYTINSARKIVLYDLNKVYLSGLNQTQGVYTFTAQNDGFLRFSYDHTVSSNVQLEIGSSATPYVPYGITIPDLTIQQSGNTDVLEGKSLYSFGDSIMKGAGNNNIGLRDLIAEKYKMSGANYAISGASIAYYSDRSHIVAQIQKAITDGITPDVIIMNGGINDVTFNVLGEISSNYNYLSNGFATFSAGLEYCFGLINNTFPSIPLVYIWVHHMPSRIEANQKAHHDRALEICQKWSVPVVDMYKDGGMNTMLTNHLQNYTYYPTETSGTHPNADGYNLFYMPPVVAEMRKRLAN